MLSVYIIGYRSKTKNQKSATYAVIDFHIIATKQEFEATAKLCEIICLNETG